MEIPEARNEGNAAGDPGNDQRMEIQVLTQLKKAVNDAYIALTKGAIATIVRFGTRYGLDEAAMKYFMTKKELWHDWGLKRVAGSRPIYYDFEFNRNDEDKQKLVQKIDERYVSFSFKSLTSSFHLLITNHSS